MTLANRTALAAGACGLLAVVLATLVSSVLFSRSVSQRVDDQLRERAGSAPLLAAVGDRIGISELAFVVAGARVWNGDEVVELGLVPAADLPPLEEPGWRTVRAEGESWRLYAVEVRDVPEPGDRAIVEFVEPLGDVNAQLRTLRRRVVAFGVVAAALVTVFGLLAGRRAARPLTELATEARNLGKTSPRRWQVEVDTSTPEVVEIAGALNHSLGELAVASRRRDEALESARSFASAAAHELRTPLQSAMINLDLAVGRLADGDRATDDRSEANIVTARAELDRLRTALDAVRRLSEVELIDHRSFVDADLAEIVDQAIGALAPESHGVRIEQVGAEQRSALIWIDGVRLAVENLVRNAVRHGIPADGSPLRVMVTVTSDGSIVVEDNGPGIPAEHRDRVVRAFERGSTSGPGSGLGLAFVDRVASLHRGSLTIEDSALGGARIELRFGPGADAPG